MVEVVWETMIYLVTKHVGSEIDLFPILKVVTVGASVGCLQ